MDTKRAKEILNSVNKVNVAFEGDSVWIDSVDEVNGVADIHVEHNEEKRRTVPVEELQEL
ncbi:H-type small acid-soluble spore protein [Xylanibacillus composti]|uniref:Small, acid-soluble spore protein H n=1 Tax=Xylanibacillus composti TaxID=1572762 RepID=A0A8J4H0W1_9BACL|nr:H-type small acid-soluble spore protein [Xylanibacillus composti]MDT9723844.1 H-type small acid-soluble spore protein [Xylanibacillus composti]GIQ67377.1 hypothetical protein XYCOK13_02010 [Xylanibacillus composti]